MCYLVSGIICVVHATEVCTCPAGGIFDRAPQGIRVLVGGMKTLSCLSQQVVLPLTTHGNSHHWCRSGQPFGEGLFPF